MECPTNFGLFMIFIALPSGFLFLGFQIGRAFESNKNKQTAVFSSWIDHTENKIPVHPDEVVIVELYNGYRFTCAANAIYWGDQASERCVKRYKIVYGE